MTRNNMFTIKLDEETNKYLTLCLFSNLNNVSKLRKMLLNAEIDCCIIKADVIYDSFHVIVAANKAVINDKFSKLITKSVYKEILYNLSISKNISESLINFGIDDNSKEIIVVFIHEKNDQDVIMSPVLNIIEGEMKPIENLQYIRDLNKIQNLYKLTFQELTSSRMLDSIVSRICVKDFIGSWGTKK